MLTDLEESGCACAERRLEFEFVPGKAARKGN
jgi:hypothetical protein